MSFEDRLGRPPDHPLACTSRSGPTTPSYYPVLRGTFRLRLRPPWRFDGVVSEPTLRPHSGSKVVVTHRRDRWFRRRVIGASALGLPVASRVSCGRPGRRGLPLR